MSIEIVKNVENSCPCYIIIIKTLMTNERAKMRKRRGRRDVSRFEKTYFYRRGANVYCRL